MITGTLKITDYDPFEVAINSIIGSFEENEGLEYYFYCLYATFKQSEKALKSDVDLYIKKLQAEKENDPEVWWSMVHQNPTHDLSQSPPLHILWQSYFITVHSELEVTWKKVLELEELHRIEGSSLTSEAKKPDFNEYIINKLKPGSILYACVNRHLALNKTYNYIRNNIVHGPIKEGPHLSDLETKISSKEIKHIQLEKSPSKIAAQITDIDFVKDYEKRILLFLKDIISTSYSMRKSSVES